MSDRIVFTSFGETSSIDFGVFVYGPDSRRYHIDTITRESFSPSFDRARRESAEFGVIDLAVGNPWLSLLWRLRCLFRSFNSTRVWRVAVQGFLFRATPRHLVADESGGAPQPTHWKF